jgi:hypothetical protein
VLGFYAGLGPILFKQVPYTMAKFAVQGLSECGGGATGAGGLQRWLFVEGWLAGCGGFCGTGRCG